MQHVIKYAIGIRRAWFFAKQKPSVSEPAVFQAKGIAQIIFFKIFFFGPSRCAVAVFRASQVRFLNLRLKERYAPTAG